VSSGERSLMQILMAAIDVPLLPPSTTATAL
jgi:hypothetical protein